MLDAAREIVDGVYFDYDVGKFNGQYFVYVAGLALSLTFLMKPHKR